MKPLDPSSIANDWARAQKRPIGRKDSGAWQIHAQQLGLDPETIDTGWQTIMGMRNRRKLQRLPR